MKPIFKRLTQGVSLSFMFLCGGFANGQDITRDSIMRKVDSLKQLIPAAAGQKKYELVFGVAYEMFDVDNNEAVKYGKEAHELALNLGDSLKIARSGRLYGQLLRRIEKSTEAIFCLNKALLIAQRNQFADEEVIILNALAVAYNYTAEYDKALKCNFRSLRLREKEGDKKKLSVSLHNIGVSYYKLSTYDKALNFYLLSLKAKQESGDKYDMGRLLINIGLCYKELKMYGKSLDFINMGMKAGGSNIDHLAVEGEYSLGACFLSLKDFPQAKFHFLRSHELARRTENKRFQAENLIGLGDVALQNNEYSVALKSFAEAEQLSRMAGYNKELLYVYLTFSEFYNQTRDYRKAALYQSKYIALKDSLNSKEVVRNLAVVQIEYEENENRARLASQDQVISIQRIALERQQMLVAAVLIISILLIALMALVYRASSLRKEIGIQLDKRVQERTRELASNREQLLHTLNERSLLLEVLSRKLNASLATIKGISILNAKDGYGDYAEKFEGIAEQMTEVVMMMQRNK